MHYHLTTDDARERLWRFFRREGRLPSYGEMCHVFNYASKNAAFRLVKKLIDQGIVEKGSAGKLIPKNLSIPAKILGTVQAGLPTSAEEVLVDTLSLDAYLISKPEETFLLRVTGDSMIDEGIKPGDLVIIERGRKAKHGDVVLAQIDGEWTLKFLEKQKGQVRLIAGNARYAPLVPLRELILGGVITGVVRRYV